MPSGTRRVYADKAYYSQAHREYLRERKIKNCILAKGYRNRPLSKRQENQNRTWGKIRSAIEPRINDLKNWCSMQRLRYYSLVRNRLWIMICGLACIGKRAIQLQAMST
ncbi:MAG: transposase [Chlamydiae bacterium]|nr:transposase [Chlamydiota bacterium]MBI3267118.1 transposase [Chlamydiota bacterium]